MGIDIGSGLSKGVVIRDGEPFVQAVLPSGLDYRATARGLISALLTKGILTEDNISGIAGTGSGGSSVPGVTEPAPEMSCCARGINRIFPAVRTVIDFGDQSTRIIRVSPEGSPTNFIISEKCAAGSGRFLKIIANVLQIDLKELGPLSLKANNPVTFSTGCAVFGETEAISRVAEGSAKEDIIAGVHISLASKISALVERVGLEPRVALCGGGGLDAGLIKKVEERLGVVLLIPPEPLIVTALGAAIIAQEKFTRRQTSPSP